MGFRIELKGPVACEARCAALLCRTVAEVWLRRQVKGPRSAQWNLAMEAVTELAKRQLGVAFATPEVERARQFLATIEVRSQALTKVRTQEISEGELRGTWFFPQRVYPDMSILYLHGGGYSFYPRNFYDNLSAQIALAAAAKVFALDYRLSPEHKFPAQLEDAMRAYRWLLQKGADPGRMVLAGDSAGGNLAMALLLRLRDSGVAMPALTVCLSPATDFAEESAWAPAESEFDWITPAMALRWVDWFCTKEQRNDPLVSPINADLRGLPPIYIQAGGYEILLAGMQEFVRRAEAQGADVVLEIWPEMNHDFQAFGENVPESMEAMARIGEVIASRVARGAREHARR